MQRETYEFQVPNHPGSTSWRLLRVLQRGATLPLAGSAVYIVLAVGLTIYIGATVAFAVGFALPGAVLVYHIFQDAVAKRKRAGGTVLFLCFLVLATTGVAYLYSGIR